MEFGCVGLGDTLFSTVIYHQIVKTPRGRYDKIRSNKQIGN